LRTDKIFIKILLAADVVDLAHAVIKDDAYKTHVGREFCYLEDLLFDGIDIIPYGTHNRFSLSRGHPSQSISRVLELAVPEWC
jgi:hypothetical protein